MKLSTSLPLFASLLAISLAAPRNPLEARHNLEARQKDVTYTITCLGPKCTDYPPTTVRIPTSIPSIPGGNPGSNPTTTPKTSSPVKATTLPPPKSSTKVNTSSSKYTPPVQTPTKTTKTTEKPTETGGEETGPSSTRCPVPLHYKCGGWHDGKPWSGCTVCVAGAKCVVQNEWYYQCVAIDS